MTPSEWSKAVIERDWKCCDCGAVGPLHAHHVKPKATHPELKFELSNGVALCPTCHWKRHRADPLKKPRDQSRKRGPHRSTLEKQLARAEAMLSITRDQLKNLEREHQLDLKEIKRIRAWLTRPTNSR